MKVGILTGGGDCPGLNSVIRAIVLKSAPFNWEIIGFRKGWLGIIENEFVPLNKEKVENMLKDRYGRYAGLVHLYLYHYGRILRKKEQLYL